MLTDRRLGEGASCRDREDRERAQRLVLARRWSFEHLPGDHALREVVPALEAAAARDDEPAAVPERLEDHLGRLPVPHAAAALALEVA